MNQARILYEDQDIIVCHKAAGIATQTARVGQADMVSEITNYLTNKRSAQHDGDATKRSTQHDGAATKIPTQHDGTAAKRSAQENRAAADRRRTGAKTGQTGRKDGVFPQAAPYVGVVHRLDQPVEGVLVFARNKQAAAELSRQITDNRMEKYYYAIVCGQPPARTGTLTDYLLRDGRTNTSRIVPPEVKDAKRAVLDYEILTELPAHVLTGGNTPKQSVPDAESPPVSLARIQLHTGRHHQIRVQMSHAGMSLLGDYKYAGEETVRISGQMQLKEVALCAYRLVFAHPRTGERMDIELRPEGRAFQHVEWFA